jgi:hypothetical protein
MSKRSALIALAYLFAWIGFLAALLTFGGWFASRFAIT